MAVGIFATYDEVLVTAGPIGIWLWVIAAVGQSLVALVVAQLAARIPLSGSSYQWASRLASPKVGWGFGWLTFCYLAIGVVAVDNALASQAFMPLVGIEPDEGTARLITLAVLLVQTVIAVAYGSTIVLYLAVRKRLDRRKGAFDLGRFELPVAICALVWNAHRAVRAGGTPGGARLRRDRGRAAPRGRGVLPRHAEVRPRGAGVRARDVGAFRH